MVGASVVGPDAGAAAAIDGITGTPEDSAAEGFYGSPGD
jgi:hypothetical protein